MPTCVGQGGTVQVSGSGLPYKQNKGSRNIYFGRLYGQVLRGSLKRSATISLSGRTRDPYFEILGAPRGIMVTPSGGFDF